MKPEITKLVADGHYTEALCLYSHFHARSFRSGNFTFPSLLKSCVKLKSRPQGQMLHAHLLKVGFQADIYTATTLADMYQYMKFHLLDSAIKVFNEIPEPNIASFNVVISGFSQNGYCKEAFRIFRVVSMPWLRPDSVTILLQTEETTVVVGEATEERQYSKIPGSLRVKRQGSQV